MTTLSATADDGSLSEQTLSSLREFFERSTTHRPSPAMWDALADLAVTLERMAEGVCPPAYYLSSLDPGVGKTQTITQFVRALARSHGHVGVLLCVSRLDEIRTLAAQMGLLEEAFAVVTSDEALNRLGCRRPDAARVLFTTQQMVERRCGGRRFAAVEELHYRGRPRQVRIWDESILPGQALTLNRDDIGSLFKPLRAAHPELTEGLDRMFRDLGEAKDGASFEVPDFERRHGVDLNDVLGLLRQAPEEQRATASALWLLAGRTAVVRRDGRYGNAVLDYRETLPDDLAPLVVLDASGRVRATYAQWEARRGGLVRLRSAPKSYRDLTVHVWTRGGGKGAFRARGKELCDGIASTINGKPGEEWLVVCHQPRSGAYDVERDVRDLLRVDQGKVHFLTWGNHHATNAYGHVPNVILAGTLFYRASYYEALGRLSSGLGAGEGRYPEDDLKAIVAGEHRHLILQALCRGAVRVCRGDACARCDAYVIADVRSGIRDALSEIFPGCRVERWRPVGRALRGKVREAAEFVARWFGEHEEDYLPFRIVMAAIGVTNAANFRKNVRQHPDFEETLAGLDVIEHGDGAYPRGFLRVTDWAAWYGFEVEDEEGLADPSNF